MGRCENFALNGKSREWVIFMDFDDCVHSKLWNDGKCVCWKSLSTSVSFSLFICFLIFLCVDNNFKIKKPSSKKHFQNALCSVSVSKCNMHDWENRIEIALRTNYRLSSDIRREWSKVNKRHWLISSIYHIDAVCSFD